VSGIDDDDSPRQLRALIKRVLGLREERSAITADIGDVLKEARARGFDSKKITEVCQWLERVDKHGRDAMVEAEALFDLYRDIAEEPDRPLSDAFSAARDKVLVAMFAGGDEPPAPKETKRHRALRAAMANAQAARRALEG
jgi:uncharacterized protein (UPF0335 family)